MNDKVYRYNDRYNNIIDYNNNLFIIINNCSILKEINYKGYSFIFQDFFNNLYLIKNNYIICSFPLRKYFNYITLMSSVTLDQETDEIIKKYDLEKIYTKSIPFYKKHKYRSVELDYYNGTSVDYKGIKLNITSNEKKVYILYNNFIISEISECVNGGNTNLNIKDNNMLKKIIDNSYIKSQIEQEIRDQKLNKLLNDNT